MTEKRMTAGVWWSVASATALACLLAFALMHLGGRLITPLWLAAGVAVGFMVVYGRRALAPVALGHCAIWLAIPPHVAPAGALAVPLLYAGEAWLIYRFGYCRQPVPGKGESAALPPIAWSYLGAPLVIGLPVALLSASLFTLSGRFSPEQFATTVSLILMAHVHGNLAFTSLTIHFLRGDFRGAFTNSSGGILAGVAALVSMALAFSGAFDGFLSPAASIFVPFPFLVMAAVWLTPAAASLLIALWCIISSALTCFGSGPFDSIPSDGALAVNPAELALYNMAMSSVVYLVSVGSSHLLRQLRLNEMALAAAGIELWEWDAAQGFALVQATRGKNLLSTTTDGFRGENALARLAGGELPQTADFWRSRLANGRFALESMGRIVSRAPDGQPLKALGLLQDLSAIQRADEAMVALGQQKARLRSLQSQLNPHFLFNSLNVIRALVHIDADSADDAITSLADLLRSNLRSTEATLISLAEELEQIRALLHLARLRFGERLRAEIRVPDELLDVQVPPMMMLNLVENAITHGIGKLAEGGTIAISARAEDEQVRISIRNTGHLPGDAHGGLGTRDALQRLEMLFGGQGVFTLRQHDPQTVAAEICLPA